MRGSGRMVPIKSLVTTEAKTSGETTERQSTGRVSAAGLSILAISVPPFTTTTFLEAPSSGPSKIDKVREIVVSKTNAIAALITPFIGKNVGQGSLTTKSGVTPCISPNNIVLAFDASGTFHTTKFQLNTHNMCGLMGVCRYALEATIFKNYVTARFFSLSLGKYGPFSRTCTHHSGKC